MTYWQTQHFKALQKAWYQRLEAAGFEDVEELVNGEMLLKQSAQHVVRNLDEIGLDAKVSYFRALAQNVHEAEFRNEVDKTILTRFADGENITKICEVLSMEGRSRCRHTVRYTIRKYEMNWGIRSYTPKQLHKKESA